MGKFSLLAALGVLAFLAMTRAMPQPGSNSFSEESAKTRKMLEESPETRETMERVREVCRNNSGSDEAYIALTEAVGSAIVCVKASVDLDNFISDVDALTIENRTTFFPKFYGKCCLKENDLTNVMALTGIYPGAVDLFCKNDGEIMFTLAEPKYRKCLYNLRNNVKECTVPFAAQSEDWDISNLTQTQYETFSGLRQCIEDKLNDCENLMSVYDVFHNTLFRLASCRNVRPFLEDAFVSFVSYITLLTHNTWIRD